MKNETIKPEKPGGFLDFSTREFLAREKMLGIIDQVFRSFGYNPIETPMIEFTKTLTGSDETSKNIFQVKSRCSQSEGSLALRFDHTVPLARFLSANPYEEKKRSGIRLPWRRLAVGPVFRSDSPQKGRYRQFYQFDIDIAGCSLMLADAEVITVMYETLKALGLKRFVIKLNNRKILNGLAELLDITDRSEVSAADITKEVMRILDKIPKLGLEKILVELAQEPDNEFDPRPGLKSEAFTKLQEYLALQGDNDSKVIQAQKLFAGIQIAEEGLAELEEIIDYLERSGVPREAVEIDFSVARGLDYYTGPVFETFLFDTPEFGSVFSGGRYNDLVARFTGHELPAVGASIGVDRLFAALQQLDALKIEKSSVADILILRLRRQDTPAYLQVARSLRQSGFRVEISLLEDLTFQAQFNFAVSQGVNFVIIAGPMEIDNRVFKIKNLTTRQQTEVPQEELIHFFKSVIKT